MKMRHQGLTVCTEYANCPGCVPANQPEGKWRVVQNWVDDLPRRAQGTLMTGIRGCDLAPKNPGTIDETYGCSTGEGSPERRLVAFLRYCVLNPADPREVGIPGAWFQDEPGEFKPSQFGHYPLHWYGHLMHCFEVVGYYHPNPILAAQCKHIYQRLVWNLHLNPESKKQLEERLTLDRIAAGNVVS